MLLLPILLREATGRETLGYQVSPGLAEASGYKIAVLQNEGSRVAYLVDGDQGGKAIEAKLQSIGVKAGKVVSLKEVIGSECVTEDFVDKTVYAEAITAELERSGHNERITATDLPDNLRPGAVRALLEAKNIPEPSKVSVAYRILDRLGERDLADPDRIDALCQIHSQINESFEKESQ